MSASRRFAPISTRAVIVPGAGGACNDPRTPSREDGAEDQRELESMRFTIGHNQPPPGASKIIAARPGCENKRDRSRCGWFSRTRPRASLAAMPESPPPVLLPSEVVGLSNREKADSGGYLRHGRLTSRSTRKTRPRRLCGAVAPRKGLTPPPTSLGDERTLCAGSACDRRSSTSCPHCALEP
jgi:hypothetical protein